MKNTSLLVLCATLLWQTSPLAAINGLLYRAATCAVRHQTAPQRPATANPAPKPGVTTPTPAPTTPPTVQPTGGFFTITYTNGKNEKRGTLCYWNGPSQATPNQQTVYSRDTETGRISVHTITFPGNGQPPTMTDANGNPVLLDGPSVALGVIATQSANAEAAIEAQKAAAEAAAQMTAQVRSAQEKEQRFYVATYVGLGLLAGMALTALNSAIK